MHPELEKLIDLAVVNGQISQKEKAIILKKAKHLGIDTEEAEMLIAGKLEQLEAVKSTPEPVAETKMVHISEKPKTCPHCGDAIPSLALNCPSCGHEFTNIAANRTIAELQKALMSISNTNTVERVVQNFPIPNTKDDLIEMFSFMSSRVLASDDWGSTETDAYHTKALEVLSRLKLTPGVSSALISQMEETEKKMRKHLKVENNKGCVFGIVLLVIFYFLLAAFLLIFDVHWWPFLKRSIPVPDEKTVMYCPKNEVGDRFGFQRIEED